MEETDLKPDASELDLDLQWRLFRVRWHTPDRKAAFRDFLRAIVADPDAVDDLDFCGDCGDPGWDMDSVQSGTVCGSCMDDYCSCDCCEDLVRSQELTRTLENSGVCDPCRDHCSYCEHCDGYYHDDNSSEHDHSDTGCCESPQLSFTIRNDGCEPLANDTPATVTLPGGTISAAGIEAIQKLLQCISYGAPPSHFNLPYDLDQLGDQWQDKTGNYAKRLSRLAHKKYAMKIPQDLLSQIGCIARDHSNPVDVRIEVTRKLNMDAGEFYHSDSCWWGSYSESRCALKTNGGFGLRSFSGNYVSGRAWVMPLRLDEQGKLTPTFNTRTPAAFMVFNGYGDLAGYAAARIMAHLAGWTYRKTGFSCDQMYINAGGYLIAPEDIAARHADGVSLHVDQHARLYEKEEKENASDR